MARAKVSLHPEDAIEGGGLLDDVVATIRHPRFELTDYGGTRRDTSLAFCYELEDADGNALGKGEIVSAGDKKHFTPSKDGFTLVPTGTKEGLSASSNFTDWAKHLVDCDEDAGDELREGSVEFLDGKTYHFVRVPQQKRDNLPSGDLGEGGGKSRGPRTMLVPDEIAKAGKSSGKGKDRKAEESRSKRRDEDDEDEDEQPKKKGGKKGGKASELDETLVDVVKEILDDNNGKVSKTKLATLAFRHKTIKGMEKDEMSEAIDRVGDDAFLEDHADDWSFDGTTLEAAE